MKLETSILQGKTESARIPMTDIKGDTSESSAVRLFSRLVVDTCKY